MISTMPRFFFFFTLVFSTIAAIQPNVAEASSPKQIMTNSAVINNPPAWLTNSRVQNVVDEIERKLEWSTRRVPVTFYSSQAQLLKNFNGKAAKEIMAFTKRSDNSIHIGPKVTRANFDQIFGHELAHVIIFQKYKSAIPAWLNEGLSTSVAGFKSVKFSWLAQQKPRIDVTKLRHPYEVGNFQRADVHYAASFAVIKMLEKRCPSFRELLNLSLRSNMEDYIKTFCNIPDLNKTFWAWVDENARKGKNLNKYL